MGYLTGAGSDYAAFVHYLGISSIDMSYTYDRVREKLLIMTHPAWCSAPSLTLSLAHRLLSFAQSKTNARIYPAYHTAYDTFDYCAKYIDPGECPCDLTQFQ